VIVLDTDVIIEYLRGQPHVVEGVTRLLEEGETLTTTAVNAAELHRGAVGPRTRREMLASLHELLTRLDALPLDGRAARRYGALAAGLDRAGQTMPLADGLVAAIALENGGRLLTLNKRHFARVPALELVDLE
jgi:tRNA(fMet)-specific endonuclease VapC